MKKCFTGYSLWLTAFVVLMLASQAAFPQMTLVSSTPSDGEVSVSADSTLVLQFSSPLDTTAMFDDFFLGVELFPEHENEDEPELSLSDDLTTLTVKGLKFEHDQRYTMMLSGAVSTSGDSLDRPYVITWSTGDELPVGQINGTINWAEGNPTGALVAFFEHLFDDNPVAIAVANPAYTANYVPNGSYYAVSIRDANGDGQPEFMRGDAVGMYDANEDGIPDPVEVVSEDTLYTVDISLKMNQKTTAKAGLSGIETQATEWASDAGLIGIFSEGVDAEGASFGWSYLYYSQSLSDFRMFFEIGNMKLNQPFRDDEEPPQPIIILPEFIDSDSALAVAMGNGLSEFLAEHDDLESHVGLHAFFSDSGEPNDNGNESRPDSGSSIFSKRARFAAAMPKEMLEEDPRFIWNVSFHTKYRMEDFDGVNRNDHFDIGIDAHTGEVVFGGKPLTARQALDVAEDVAKSFAEDAQLLNLGSYGLNTEGSSDNWYFKFYSQSRNELLEVGTRGMTANEMRHFPKDEYYHVTPVDVNWIDSDSAVTVAGTYGLNEFLNAHPYAWGSAVLERFDLSQMIGPRPMYKGQEEGDGIKPGPLVWKIQFDGEWDGQNQPRFEIVLDAGTGDVLFGNPSVTARQASHIADSLAAEWAEDAMLRHVDSYGLTSEGTADLWAFQYTSVTKDSVFNVVANAATGFTLNSYFYGDVDMFGVSNAWFNSDSALTIAYENGLGDYLSMHPGAMGVATLTTSYQLFGYYPPDSGDPNHPGEDSVATTLLRKGTQEKHIVSGLDLVTLWAINYHSAEGGDEWQIVLNAETGEVLSVGSAFSTARESFDVALEHVSEWDGDAALVDVEGPNFMPDGRGDRWYFNFFSAAKDSFITIGVNRGFAVERWTHSVAFTERNPPIIDFEWIDSDSATSIAMEHGLRGLLDNEYGGAYGRASLRPYFGDKMVPMPNDSTHADSAEVVFAWSLMFESYNGQSMAIDIDAKTGEVLFIGSRMTAREAFEHAFPFAGQWRDFAYLICVQSYRVDREGRSDAWTFRFGAPNVDFVLVVEVKLGRVQGVWEESGEFLSSLRPLPEDWKNSNEVAVVADDHSSGFRERHLDASVEAKLSRGLWNDDMEKPVWGFRYNAHVDNGGMDSTHVFIDAVTASMIVSGVESGQNGLPTTFALEQNYPNPFNPETNIKYQLASQAEVKLVIFNVLGQKLITLVDEVQPAGIYEVRWNGKDTSGIQQPSGMYIYQIESNTFTKTRKMLLVR